MEKRIGQLTGYFLIGDPSHFYAKINELYLLNLYEEEDIRPHYVFRPQAGEWLIDDIKVIPTNEHLLEDGLLLLAVYYLKDPVLREMYFKYVNQMEEEHFCLYEIPKDIREVLYELVKKIDWQGNRLLLTTFPPSSLNSFLEEGSPLAALEIFQSRKF
jgi:hypothetical protein